MLFYLNLFSFKGEGNGQFNAPTGVAVDSQDNILVADWGNSRSGFIAYHFKENTNNQSKCQLYGIFLLSSQNSDHYINTFCWL